MTRNRGLFSISLIALTLITAAVIADRTWPYLLSRATYAIERGQAAAAEEQLEVATDISQAFQHVARALRPSVVSVSSVKRAQANQAQMRRFGSPVPEEFRRFFGDDETFERFFEAPPAPRGFEQQGLGSGVIVSEDGYILTNNHVVQGADEVTVRLSDRRELSAEVVGTDKPTDIAVLKVKANGLHPAKFGDSSSLQVGQWALAMGSPFGLDQTVTAGIVSAVGRVGMGITDYEDFIQTDAAINPGNSGGPLVNLKGEVIGINTAIASRSGGYQGVGFSIPSNMARYVMESIINKGGVTRGYLGAVIQDLTEDLARSFGYDSNEGVLISSVVPDGPAAKAGLQEGDIVTRVNDKKVSGATELRNAIAATEPNSQVALEIHRAGTPQTVNVTIGKLEGDQIAMGAGASDGAEVEQLGMKVEDLTPELMRQLGVESNQRGVVVTQVDPTSLAARVGIRPGDLVVAVGQKAIEAVSDFRESTRNYDPQAGIRMQIQRDGVRRYIFLRSR
ncbi:MAG: DegQ family serine endoprotease [Pirellulaceae bacterium]